MQMPRPWQKDARGYSPLHPVLCIRRSKCLQEGTYHYREARLLLKKPFLLDGNRALSRCLSRCQSRMCFAVTCKCISKDYLMHQAQSEHFNLGEEKRRETKKLKQIMFLSFLCCVFTLLTFLIVFLFVCLATSFVALGTKMRQCYLLSKNVPSVNKTPPLSCDKEPGNLDEN